MRAAGGRYRPHERPAVGVKHREGPEITLVRRHVHVHERSDGIHVSITVRDHHAFGPGRRAARVIDRQEIVLVDRHASKVRRGGRDERFVIEPTVARVLECDKTFHGRQLRADAVDGIQQVAVHADDPRAAMIEDVLEIGRRQAVVDRHEDGADLRYGVKRFELRVRVRSDIRDAIAFTNAESLQYRSEAVAAIEELLVRQARAFVDDREPFGIEAACSTHEFEWRQGNVHRAPLLIER